jgi:hypothetical protein
LERLASRLTKLHTLVLRTHQLSSWDELEAILRPWKNHTLLLNVSVESFSREHLLGNEEYVLRISPINCGVRLKICGETLLTRAMKSSVFDASEVARLIAAGLSLDHVLPSDCVTVEAVQLYATHKRSYEPDLMKAILWWISGRTELIDALISTCREQNNLTLLHSIPKWDFMKLLVLQAANNTRIDEALNYIFRPDICEALQLDINMRGPNNRTLLHEASEASSEMPLIRLLDANLDPNVRDDFGLLPVETAITARNGIIRGRASYRRLLDLTTVALSWDAHVPNDNYDDSKSTLSLLHTALLKRTVPFLERIVDNMDVDQIYALYFPIGTGGRKLGEWLLTIPGAAPLLHRLMDRTDASTIVKNFRLKDICIENMSVAERVIKSGAPCSLLDFDCLIFRSNIADYANVLDQIDFTLWKGDSSLPYSSPAMLYRLINNLTVAQEELILRILDGIDANVNGSIVASALSTRVTGKDVFDSLLDKDATQWSRIGRKLVEMAEKTNVSIDANRKAKILAFVGK